MASRPAPTKPSSSLNDIASSAVQPSTLPPNISGWISRPDLPSLRFCMGAFCLRGMIGLAAGRAHPSAYQRHPSRAEKLLSRGRLAQLRLYESLIPRLVRPLDGGDVRRSARAPPQIRIARLQPHGLGDELDPVPDANAVLAVERRQLAVARVKDGADRIAAARAGGIPGLARRLGQGA